jgi:hypothetical protein
MSKSIIMINRTFKENKYSRTYIGGSKQREAKIFTKVQGKADDNSECDWLEYRRILSQYYDDVLNVLLSWKTLTKYISLVVLVASILFLHIHVIFFLMISLSIVVRTISYGLKLKIENILKNYNMCLNTTLDVIRKEIGFELNK